MIIMTVGQAGADWPNIHSHSCTDSHGPRARAATHHKHKRRMVLNKKIITTVQDRLTKRDSI